MYWHLVKKSGKGTGIIVSYHIIVVESVSIISITCFLVNTLVKSSYLQKPVSPNQSRQNQFLDQSEFRI